MIRKVAMAAAVVSAALCWCVSAQAQVSLTAPGNPVKLGFSGFNGSGYTPSPAAGQLDSDNWEINGFSSGTLNFGDTQTSGDFAKGTSTGGETGGGIYAFDVGGGNVAMGVQPTGSDYTPGDMVLRVQNNTGAVIVDMSVAYTLYINNDGDRGNDWNFSHSGDNSTYTAEASLDYTSTEASQGFASWDSIVQTITLTGVNIPDGDFYYLRWESDDNLGGGSRDEFAMDNITITPGGGSSGLNAAFTASQTCIGDTTFFTDVSSGGTAPYTYAWDFEGLGTDTTANPWFVFPSVNSYNVVLIVTDSAGTADTADIDIDVFPLPTVTASSDTSICALDTASISASGADTYVWMPGSSLIDSTAAATGALPTSTTTYTVVGTDAAGCSASTTVMVTVDNSSSPEILGDYSFCSNDAPSQIVAASSGGTWSGTGITNTSTGLFNPSVSGIGTFTVSYMTSGTCGGTDSVDVVVFNAPTTTGIFFSEYIESGGDKALEIYNPNDTAVDLSNCFIIRTNNGITSNPDTFWLNGMLAPSDVYVIANSSSSNPITSVADTSGSATFYNGNDALELWCGTMFMDVIGIPGNDPGSGGWPVGSGGTEDQTLVRMPTVFVGDTAWTGSVENQWNVYPFTDLSWIGWHTVASCNVASGPVASFTASQECEGIATIFTDASTTDVGSITGWMWDFGDSMGTDTTQNPTYTYAASGTYTVQLIISTDSMANDTTTMMVTVKPAPQVAFSSDVSSGCVPFMVSFSDSTTISSGSVVAWDWSFGNGLTSAMQNPMPTYDTAGTFMVWLAATSDLGCIDSASAMIAAGAAPVLDEAAAMANNANCGATDGSVTGITATGAGTLSYEWFNASMMSVGTSADLSAVGSGSFTLVVTDTLGCADTSAIYTIQNVGGPAAPTALGGGSYCQGETVMALMATGTGGTLTWYADSTLGMMLDTGASYTPTNLPAGTNTFYVTETTVCEGPFASVTINVNPQPMGNLTANVYGGCAPLTVTFTDSTTIASGTYSVTAFNSDDGTMGSSITSPYVYDTVGLFHPFIVVESDSGCADTVGVTIATSTPPTVDAGLDTAVCAGDSAMLMGSSSGTMYSWAPTTTLDDPSVLMPIAMPTVDTDYILTASDSIGCAASDTVTVSVLSTAPVVVDAAGPFCLNGAVEQLTANQTGGMWSGNGIVSASAGTFNPGMAGLGMHQVVYATAGSCGSADTIMVEVTNGASGATDLFFSEYIEGSSNNKALEIYNPLDVAVDLSTYIVNRYNNGSTSISGSDSLSGMIQPGDVFVICNASADAAIQAEADLVSNNSTLFNGDDFVELVNGSTPIDGIGILGNDPGSSWPVGSGATNEHTLVRMSSIVAGNTTWTGGGENEWDVYAQDDFSFIGWHTALVCSDASITAEFTATDGCEGDTTMFLDLSVSSGTITSWDWNFGDGNTSTMQNPMHVYTAAGSYTVTLVVMDDSSYADTTTAMVEVFATPAAMYSTDVTNGCTPMMVNFTNTTTGNATYAWDFGDGGSSTMESPSYEYTTAGSFSAVLTATSPDGCVGTAETLITTIDGVDLDDSGSMVTDATCGSMDGAVTGITASGNGPVSFQWEDAQGNVVGTTADLSGVMGGTYFLIVSDSIGCADSNNVFTIANTGGPAAPNVAGEADYCEGETVADLSATGGAGMFVWFADQLLTMPLDTGASFTPALSLGSNEYWVVEVTACAGPATATSLNLNPTPSVAFTPSTTAGCTPLTVDFTNGSTLSSGTMTYAWDFGDGNGSTDENPTHTFSTFTGPHTVVLTATSDMGCVGTLTETNLIEVYPLPTAALNWSQVSNTLDIEFDDLSNNAASWSWNFGDGNTSTMQEPTHTYDTAGTYTVTLTVTSADGCEDEVTETVNVLSTGIAQVALAQRIELYPNPTRGNLTINLGTIAGDARVVVLNTVGKVATAQRIAAGTGVATVNVANLANGTYMVRIETTEGVATKRIVVLK